jgi:hypothetical protein
MADFYAALQRQNDAAPLADFATALNSGARLQFNTPKMTNAERSSASIPGIVGKKASLSASRSGQTL